MITSGEDRILIVNADDFGLSAGVNRGIVEAHLYGIVTSTSAMVRPPAAVEAARLAGKLSQLSVGLHVDLGEWIYRDGEWQPRFEVVPLSAGAEAVEAEVRRQLAAFVQLFRKTPTHLDSHQHVHRHEPLRSVMRELAAELNIPLRHEHPRIVHCGGFHGQTGKGEPYPQGISVDSLTTLLCALPAGISELSCHPGAGDCNESAYRFEREQEVFALCAPAIRAALDRGGIRLCSFAQIGLGCGQ
jgi:predicted glycoside hydrolase/deacetylase ChbG (UPF0249 family)